MPRGTAQKEANIILAVCLTCSFINMLNFKITAVQEFAIDSLVALAIASDKTIANLKAQIVFQRIKRKQEQEAIRDTGEKESTAKLNTFTSTNPLEKHGLQKESNLRGKVTEIDTETAHLWKQLSKRKYELEAQVRRLFVVCYSLQEDIKVGIKNLQTEEADLPAMEICAQLGEVSPTVTKALKKSIDSQRKQLIQLKQNWETETTKLSSLTGKTFINCILKNPLVTCVIPRNKVPNMINYALTKRHDTHEVVAKRKLEENRVRVIFDVYKSQWGSKVASLESAVRSDEPLNWDAITTEYEDFLKNVNAPWEKNFQLNLLSATIRIPMAQLQGDFDGIRYLDEGKKYYLLEALQRRKEAREQEKIITGTVRQNLAENYDMVMASYQSYKDAENNRKQAESDYTEIKLGNLLGTKTSDEVRLAQEALRSAAQTATAALTTYNEELINLDKETCGWVTLLKKGEDILLFDSEIDTTSSPTKPKPHYNIENTTQNLQSIFTLTIPEETGILATDYELWVDEVQIGTRQSISQPMYFLSTTITGLSEVTVRVFNSGTFVDEADFDGIELSGDLRFKVATTIAAMKKEETETLRLRELLSDINADGPPHQIELGSYHLQNDSSISAKLGFVLFTVLPSADTIKYFRISIKDGANARVSATLSPVNVRTRKLKIMFKNLSDVEILLYDAREKLLHAAKLDETNNRLIKIEKA